MPVCPTHPRKRPVRLRSKPAGRAENGNGTSRGTLHDSKPLEGFEKSDPKSVLVFKTPWLLYRELSEGETWRWEGR